MDKDSVRISIVVGSGSDVAKNAAIISALKELQSLGCAVVAFSETFSPLARSAEDAERSLKLIAEAHSQLEIDRPTAETYSKKRRKGLTDKSNLRHKYHK